MKFNEKDNVFIHWIMVTVRLCEVICVFLFSLILVSLKRWVRLMIGAFKQGDNRFTGI